MSVIFNLQCEIISPQEFDEVRKLYEEMRSHYDIYRPKHDYIVSIRNVSGGGYVAEGVRAERKDWRVSFSRPDSESKQ